MKGMGFSFAACLMCSAATTAFAQNAAAQDESSAGGLQDIVVTAQKRSENVQDVPISIAAFDSVALKESAVADVAQLSKLSPNVTLDSGSFAGGSSSVLSAFVRGVGQSDFAFNFDPGVGVYVDGVYLGRAVGANVGLLDVERIEVLKGPQGTLFGRNTIGGAVSIVTRSPRKDFGFTGDVTAGRFNRLDVRGVVDLPVSDSVRTSLAFGVKNRDGYMKRLGFDAGGLATEGSWFPIKRGSPDEEGAVDEWNVRGKLDWDATDSLSLSLTADYTHIDSTNTPQKLLRTVPEGALLGLYNTCLNTDQATLGAIGLLLACSNRGPTQGSLAGANAGGITRLPYDDRFVTGSKDTSYATGPSYEKMNNYGVNATINLDLSPDVSLKSISAYRRLEWDAGSDLDGSPIQFIEIENNIRQRQFSEEVQLVGKALDNRLDYVIGAYYFDEKATTDDYVGVGGNFLQLYAPAAISTKAYAAFTHLNFRVTDAIGITLGARYTHEKKNIFVGQQDVNALNYKLANCFPITEACRIAVGFPDPNNPIAYAPAGRPSATFNNFAPRIGLEYHVNDDAMLFASFSKGYKTGSWTTRLTNPSATLPSFNPEKATSYEAGFKSELFARTVRFNGAFFYTQYKDIQLNFKESVSPTIKNAGDANIWGLEAEITFAPTARFSVQTGGGYIHARYTDNLNPSTGLTQDNRLPKTPEWKFVISPRYELPLPNSAAIVVRADYSYTSGLFNDAENSPLLKRPSVDDLAASITYRAPGNWELSIGGTNLLNERYLVTGESQLAGGAVYGTYSRPVEWYARLGVTF